jgi:hypothetical protein
MTPIGHGGTPLGFFRESNMMTTKGGVELLGHPLVDPWRNMITHLSKKSTKIKKIFKKYFKNKNQKIKKSSIAVV